jgi:hypothetical protein
MSHAPGFGGRWDLLDEPRRATLAAGIAQAQRLVEAAAPDLIIAFVNDHFKNFTLKDMPAFCIGVGEFNEAPSSEAAQALGIPARTIEGEPEVAMALLDGLMEAGFDPAFSAELSFYDDLSVPLFHLFGPTRKLPPIVPIVTNCVAPPMPTFRRSRQIGAAVRTVLAAMDDRYRRVMVLGSGGLSHWVGTPKTGEINGAFDFDVLQMVCRGHADDMSDWRDAEIDHVAGNGALELKNWLAALSTIGSYDARQLAYAPAREWLTGIAIVAVNASEAVVPA